MALNQLTVLIGELDIISRLNGPASFYRRLIERNPDIHFVFPVTTAGTCPFPNGEPVCLSPVIRQDENQPGNPYAHCDLRAMAADLAAAVAGRRFDAVDVRSGRPLLQFLRPALRQQGVTATRFVISLQGWASDVQPASPDGARHAASLDALRTGEQASLAAADCAYGFADFSAAPNRSRNDTTNTHLEPSDVLGMVDLAAWIPNRSEPCLWAIDAQRPDLVMDLAASMPLGRLAKVCLVANDRDGGATRDRTGLDCLRNLAVRAGVPTRYIDAHGDWTADLLSQRGVVAVLGTKRFSLAGAEALLRGIPLAVNREADLARWLQRRHPRWPVLRVTESDLPAAATQLESLLSQYDSWRHVLHEAIQIDPPDPPRRNFMIPIYRSANGHTLVSAIPFLARPLDRSVDIMVPSETPAATASAVQPSRKPRTRPKRLPALLRRYIKAWLWTYEQYPPRRLKVSRRYAAVSAPASAPRIAIVTPTFNYGHFLGATVDSVLGQLYPALDYFVKDAASRDGTRAVLIGYGDRLKWLSEPDTGQANAINTGFRHVDGDIMAWLNSDDLLVPGTLAYVARYFAEHPEIDLIYGHRIFIDRDNAEVGRCVLPPHDPDALRYADYVPQETLFWRRRVWEALGGLDESFQFALDWDFLLRAQAAGFVCRRVPRFLGCFRVHDQQKTAAWASIGAIEQSRLRKRWIGPDHDQYDIRVGIRPYLKRHLAYHYAYRLGLLRY